MYVYQNMYVLMFIYIYIHIRVYVLIYMYNVSILHLTLWNLQRIVGLPPQSLGVSFYLGPQGLRVHALMSLGGTTSLAGTDLLFLY